MAIKTLNDLLISAQPVQYIFKLATGTTTTTKMQSQWGRAGIPGPGTYATTAAGSILSSSSSLVPGQIPFTNPGPGQTLYIINTACTLLSVTNVMFICDRLWHNGGLSVTSTSPQTINSVTWPARDDNNSTNGKGVLIGLEFSAVVGASTTQNITITYTNSDGIAGRTGTWSSSLGATGTIAGSFLPFVLQGTDKGVRSIQSFQLSTSLTSGTINLVAYRILAYIQNTNIMNKDAFQLGMPVVPSGAVPFLLSSPDSTTSSIVAGHIQFGVG